MAMTGIRELYDYNEWANARTLGAAAQLTADDFTRDMRNSFPSVRDTLVHMLLAEWIWLQRWQGVSPAAMPEGWNVMMLPELRIAWSRVSDERARYLSALTDHDLHRVFDYTNMAGAARAAMLGDALRHVVNHSTYHRGQITTMLRQLGAAPAPTDLLLFFEESRNPKG